MHGMVIVVHNFGKEGLAFLAFFHVLPSCEGTVLCILNH